nr:MAG TPA: hypothetical protein [Caudoviricetes sp.]
MELPIIEPSFFERNLRSIDTPDGTFVDFAYRDMIVDKDDTTIMSSPILVTEEFNGRPDLLALAIFGDQSKFDIICEYNSLSDPFSITAGDILYIPTSETLSLNNRVIAQGLSKVIEKNDTLGGNLNLPNKSMQELNSKIQKIDPSRSKLRGNVSQSEPVRTPNMTTAPPTTFVQNGEIELGTNLGSKVCKTAMTDAQSLAYSIREAVLRKIKDKK